MDRLQTLPLREYLAISESSPTGLVWLQSPGPKIRAGQPALTAVCRGYYVGQFMGVNLKAHRVIYFLATGTVPKCIDHINGVRTDNRWNNLRVATVQQNNFNSKVQSNNSTGVKGVSREGSRWLARICVNGVRRRIGTYATRELAEQAYLEEARKHHGEFYCSRD